MTFNDLTKAQPELKEIKAQAAGWRQRPDRWEAYEKLKARMKKCVGYQAAKDLPEFMLTSEAYDIAHKEIFKS